MLSKLLGTPKKIVWRETIRDQTKRDCLPSTLPRSNAEPSVCIHPSYC